MPLKKMIVCTLIVSSAGSFVYATDDERSVAQQGISGHEANAQNVQGEKDEEMRERSEKWKKQAESMKRHMKRKNRKISCLLCIICPCFAPCICAHHCYKENCRY